MARQAARAARCIDKATGFVWNRNTFPTLPIIQNFPRRFFNRERLIAIAWNIVSQRAETVARTGLFLLLIRLDAEERPTLLHDRLFGALVEHDDGDASIDGILQIVAVERRKRG